MIKFQAEFIPGLFSIELDPFTDERGSFARVFCEREFAAAGLPTRFEQANLSTNPHRATLRGVHFQLPPHCEGKLLRAQRGAIYDVAIDLRPSSPTFGQSFGKVLDSAAGSMLYVPAGCGHAFLTLEPNTEVLYMATHSYVPGAERGIRHDDPAFTLGWPIAPAVISAKDANWPDFDATAHRRMWDSAERGGAA